MKSVNDMPSPRKPTTPPGSPPKAPHNHPKRILVEQKPISSTSNRNSPGLESPRKFELSDKSCESLKMAIKLEESTASSPQASEVAPVPADIGNAGEGGVDEIVLYGQSKTTWRSAAAVAHFVGDGCMAVAQRAHLSALSAVGLYFVAVRTIQKFVRMHAHPHAAQRHSKNECEHKDCSRYGLRLLLRLQRTALAAVLPQ